MDMFAAFFAVLYIAIAVPALYAYVNKMGRRRSHIMMRSAISALAQPDPRRSRIHTVSDLRDGTTVNVSTHVIARDARTGKLASSRPIR